MDDNNAESPQRRRRESFFFIGDTESGNNVHQFNPLLPPLLLNSNTPSSAKRYAAYDKISIKTNCNSARLSFRWEVWKRVLERKRFFVVHISLYSKQKNQK